MPTGLQAVMIERVFSNECCCYSEESCRWAGKTLFGALFSGYDQDILVMPGYSFPEKQCPTYSRVYAAEGFIPQPICRPFEVHARPPTLIWCVIDSLPLQLFQSYDKGSLDTCRQFLPEDGVYHQADTTYWDRPGNDISAFNKLLKGALSETCYAEIGSFICNTFYRLTFPLLSIYEEFASFVPSTPKVVSYF